MSIQDLGTILNQFMIIFDDRLKKLIFYFIALLSNVLSNCIFNFFNAIDALTP